MTWKLKRQTEACDSTVSLPPTTYISFSHTKALWPHLERGKLAGPWTQT